jgi:hypothetical protein
MKDKWMKPSVGQKGAIELQDLVHPFILPKEPFNGIFRQDASME